MRTSQRAVFFDASAIIAYHVDEPMSEVLRGWWRQEATKYTSSLCFFESLNAYKSKWKFQGKLTHEQYRQACFNTYQWYQASIRHIRDLDFNSPKVFQDAYLLAMKHSLDLSDAFQIVSVRDGFFAVLVNDSQTILCTGDADLARVARVEGLKVWDFKVEPPPE
jgi:predicted nucleic acid-binding protein